MEEVNYKKISGYYPVLMIDSLKSEYGIKTPSNYFDKLKKEKFVINDYKSNDYNKLKISFLVSSCYFNLRKNYNYPEYLSFEDFQINSDKYSYYKEVNSIMNNYNFSKNENYIKLKNNLDSCESHFDYLHLYDNCYLDNNMKSNVLYNIISDIREHTYKMIFDDVHSLDGNYFLDENIFRQPVSGNLHDYFKKNK